MQSVLRAFNRWTVLAAFLLGTLLAINARVETISAAGGNAPVFAAASISSTATHGASGKIARP